MGHLTKYSIAQTRFRQHIARNQRATGDDQDMKSERNTAILALAAAGLLWGLTVPLSKLALGWLAPAWLTAARFAVAAPLLAVAARHRLREAATLPVILAGALGFGGVVMLQSAGIDRTSVSHAAVVVGAVPVLVALIGAALGNGVGGRRAWTGYGLALGGVAAVAGGDGGGATPAGDLLVLASAVLSAAFIVVQPRLLAGRDAAAVTAVQFVAGAVISVPAGLLGEGLPTAPPAAGPLLAFLALAIVGTLLPFWLFAHGQIRVPAALAGAFVNLEPVVGALTGWVAFGDATGPSQIAGAGAVLLGIVLSATASAAGPEVEPVPPATAEPPVDQHPRDRDRRRQLQRAARIPRRLHLRPGKPAHILELPVACPRCASIRDGGEPEHQGRRKRPRLRADIAGSGREDPGLLVYLAHHGLLRRLPRRHEPGQQRVAARRPARPAAEQQPVLMRDEHDHHGVGAREVRGATAGAAAREAALGQPGERAADGAVGVAAMPGHQRHEVGRDPAFAGGQRRAGVAERDERTGCRRIDREVEGEQRPAVLEPEQHELRTFARGQRHAQEPTRVMRMDDDGIVPAGHGPGVRFSQVPCQLLAASQTSGSIEAGAGQRRAQPEGAFRLAPQ
jgi:O-acetylserine/cysteine efflux transporter